MDENNLNVTLRPRELFEVSNIGPGLHILRRGETTAVVTTAVLIRVREFVAISRRGR